MEREIGPAVQPEPPITSTGHSGVSRWLTLVLGLLTIAVTVGHFRGWLHKSPADFSAFYCGGQAVLHHHDPYRVEPGLTCEAQLAGNRAVHLENKVVLPAPLPGYDFIPLAALAMLPPRIATLLYGMLTLGSVALIAYCIVRLSALPAGVALAVASIGVAYNAIDWGQLAPFAIGALALAALLLRADRPKFAGVVLCLSLIQPQFGIPAVLSTFLFERRTRLTIAISVVALFIAALAAVGFRGLEEYPKVLSLQSQAEVYWVAQYSLTWLLHALGSSINVALIAGSLSYALLVFASLLIISRHRSHATSNGCVMLLPAAAAVLGGSFIHLYQIKVALLAAIVIFGTDTLGLGAAVAIGLLIMPFDIAHLQFKVTEAPTIFVALAAIWSAIYFLTRNQARSLAIVRASAVSSIAALYFVVLYVTRPHESPRSAMTGITIVHDPTALAPLEWLQYMEHFQSLYAIPVPLLLLEKAPTWLGLIMLLWSVSRSLIVSAPYTRHRAEAKHYTTSGA